MIASVVRLRRGVRARRARERRARERRAPGRRARAALAITVVLPVLAGCAAGQLAATARHVSTAGGANGQVGEIHVEHAQITFDGPVEGDAVYRPGAAAPLQVTIINSGDVADRLVAVSSPVASAVQLTGDTRMPGGHALTAGYDDPLAAVTLPKTTAIDITLAGLTTPLRAGLTYPVTFRFERAGELTLELPIEYPDDVPAPRAGEEPPEVDNLLETGPEIPVVPPR